MLIEKRPAMRLIGHVTFLGDFLQWTCSCHDIDTFVFTLFSFCAANLSTFIVIYRDPIAFIHSENLEEMLLHYKHRCTGE